MSTYKTIDYPTWEAAENKEGRLSVQQLDALLVFYRRHGNPEKVVELEGELAEQEAREGRQWPSSP